MINWRKSAGVLALSLLALFGAACSEPGTGAVGGQNQLPDNVFFQDDFSNTFSGWGVYNQEGAVVEYHNGGLRILVEETQYDFWSVAGKDYADVQLEADAAKLGGPDDNDFGLICRYQNKDNFYMLVVSSDGYYGIAKMKDGQYSMIGPEQLQYSPAIAQGQAANHLQANCVGSVLTLSVNGQELIEALDTDFTSGDVGLLAGAYDTPGVDILFDNFMVKKP